MSTYDDWKQTDPADNELGRSGGKPERFRCRDCAWSGAGVLPASDHFWATGHTVLPASDPRFKGKRQTERASA